MPWPNITVKMSKDIANYSKGNAMRRCELCDAFRPDRRPTDCRRVLGEIQPQMWCRLFGFPQNRK
jgi:hypothetical protein